MLSCIIGFDCLSIRISLEKHETTFSGYQSPLENIASAESPKHRISIVYNRGYENSSLQCERKELCLFRGKVYTRVIQFVIVRICIQSFNLSKSAFVLIALSISFIVSFSSSLFPPYRSLVEFMESRDRVFEFSLRGIHWFWLRDVCYDPIDISLTLSDVSEADLSRIPALQKYVSVKTLPHSELTNIDHSSRDNESAWFWSPSPDLEGLMQQLLLVQSFSTHPDFFPPVDLAVTWWSDGLSACYSAERPSPCLPGEHWNRWTGEARHSRHQSNDGFAANLLSISGITAIVVYCRVFWVEKNRRDRVCCLVFLILLCFESNSINITRIKSCFITNDWLSFIWTNKARAATSLQFVT